MFYFHLDDEEKILILNDKNNFVSHDLLTGGFLIQGRRSVIVEWRDILCVFQENLLHD